MLLHALMTMVTQLRSADRCCIDAVRLQQMPGLFPRSHRLACGYCAVVASALYGVSGEIEAPKQLKSVLTGQ